MQNLVPSWVIGNWKQNPATLAEVTELTSNLKTNLTTTANLPNLMVLPSTLHLASVANSLQDTNLLVGCQDVSSKNDTIGAFTGDCSAQQLADVGADWALVGHSERREYYHEDGNTLIEKIKNADTQKLGIIFCIGETLADYESNNTIEVLQSQLDVIKQWVAQLDASLTNNLVGIENKLIVAYEPVWAIGTGKIPSTQEVEDINQQIRAYLTSITPSLAVTPILYGGSVKADNASDFAACKNIDGVLVGGASLKADQFMQIAQAFSNNC